MRSWGRDDLMSPATETERYRQAEMRVWRAHGATPVEHRLHLIQSDVEVRIQEVGDGPPVLFIHGANTSGASWISLASRLSDFRCLVLDRPGTGLSNAMPQAPTAKSVLRLGDTLVADVLDALGIASAHLVATSLGGYIALRSTAAEPDRVGRMVQFSWPVGAPTTWLPWFMRATGIPGVRRLMAALPASEGSVRMTFRRIGHGPSVADGRITREDLDCYLAMLRYTDTMRYELGLARVFVSPLRGLRRMLLPAELLANVRAPTRFVWGEQDPFGGPDVARGVVRLLPNATLEVLARAGHAPWLDELEHCASAVRLHLLGGRSAASDA